MLGLLPLVDPVLNQLGVEQASARTASPYADT